MDRNHDTLVMAPQQQQQKHHQPAKCIEAAATAPTEGVEQRELQVEGTTSDEHLVGGGSSAERNGSAAIAALIVSSTIDLPPTTEGKATTTFTSSSTVNTPRSAVAASECNSSSKVTGGLSVSAASVVSADGESSSAATVNDSTRNRRRAVIGVRYKTKFCHTFMESGECRYGDSCVFAHGEEEQSKYLAIAEAAERDNSNNANINHTATSSSSHRHHHNTQPAKFTIPLPCCFYNMEGGGNPLAAHHTTNYSNGGDDDEQHRGSRDYGFGVSAEEERRRALEGNRRVPHAELERHRLQRKAEAIARVNKLHEDEDYHHHNNNASSSATMSDILATHNEEEGHAAASLSGMSYGPYIGNGMYFFTNCNDGAESSSQHDGGLTADFSSSVDMGTTTASGIGAGRGSSSTLADSSSTTMVDMIGRSSGGSSPSKCKKVYTHNPYCSV